MIAEFTTFTHFKLWHYTSAQQFLARTTYFAVVVGVLPIVLAACLLAYPHIFVSILSLQVQSAAFADRAILQ